MKEGNYKEFVRYMNGYMKDHTLDMADYLDIVNIIILGVVADCPYPEDLKKDLLGMIEDCFNKRDFIRAQVKTLKNQH